MIEAPINEQTFLTTAMKFYDNPQCFGLKEFENDLKKFLYLKKLFNRYLECGELRERLIINHIIILFNLFGVATPEMLFFKIDKEHWNLLATFLVFLDRMPEQIPEFNINLADLELDSTVTDILEKSIGNTYGHPSC